MYGAGGRIPTVTQLDNTAHAETHEAELLAELPHHLRGKIVESLLQEELAALEPLRGIPPGSLSQLAAGLKPRVVPAGQDICRPGEPCDCLWVLQKGTLPCEITQRISVESVIISFGT